MSYRTQRDLEGLTLPAGKTEVFHFDSKCPGLAVRIQRSSKPTFVVWYTAPGGKRKRLTLGAVAGIKLDDARRQATNIVNAARAGRDPSAEQKQAKATAAGLMTVGDLVEDYLEHGTRKQRPRTLAETRRALEQHWKPLHGSPASVDRRAVSGRLLDLTRCSGPVAANRARAALSACFAWGMEAGLVDANPTIGTVRNDERSRERVLTSAELRSIWQATEGMDGYDAIVRLLLLTGARRAEVGGMAWAELSEDRTLWTLPGSRTKNRRAHEIPLSRQARAIIAEFPELPGRAYVFGRGGRAPFSGWSQSKARLDARIAEQHGEAIAEWHLHDLRRSAVTIMAENGLAQPHIIEAIVNHASGHRSGVAGIYNRAVYRAEKAAGLQRWADWIEGIVTGEAATSNVVALR